MTIVASPDDDSSLPLPNSKGGTPCLGFFDRVQSAEAGRCPILPAPSVYVRLQPDLVQTMTDRFFLTSPENGGARSDFPPLPMSETTGLI